MAVDRRTVNGSAGKDVLYNWKQGEYSLEGSVSDKNPDFNVILAFPFSVYPDRKDDMGNPWISHIYRLVPSASTLEPVYTDIFRTIDYESRTVLVEADPAAASGTGNMAAEDYYPPVNASYGGTSVVPDGSERLMKVTMLTWGTTLNVVTEFNYSQDGKLIGTDTYFDGRSSYNQWDQNQEADDEGRLVKMLRGGWTYEYVYGDDDSVYTERVTRSDGIVKEEQKSVADYLIPDFVKRTPEEIAPGGVFEYGEDGLPVHGARMIKYGDGREELLEESYTYSYENTEHNDHFVIARSDGPDDSHGPHLFDFDIHGYLTEYNARYLSYYYIFKYEYVDQQSVRVP